MPQAGSSGGFFAGLLNSVGTGLQENQQKKREKDLEAQRMSEGHETALFQFLAKGVEDKSLKADAAAPILASLLSKWYGGATGAGDGKGKKGKGSSDGIGAVMGDPAKLAPMLSGAHGLVEAFTGLFRKPEERQAEASKEAESTAAATSKGTTTGKAEGELLAMQGAVDRGQAKDLKEAAFLLYGRKPSAAGVKVIPGSMTAEQIRAADPNPKNLSGEPFAPENGASYQRVQIPNDEGESEFRYLPAPPSKAPTTRSHLTGDALQAYDMNQMLAGIDPETGAPPTNPADTARLVAAGQEMKKARDLKNQFLILKIDTGKSSVEDVKELAPQVANGTLLPSQISAMGGGQRMKLMAEANRLRRRDGLSPLNYRQMQLEFYGAQRLMASMKGPQMTRFRGLAGSVINTIDEVNALAEELRQGSVQKFNSAKRNTILQVYGNTPQSETAARYVAAVNTLKEEFANLAQGGYAPTEAAWKLANQQINEDYGLKDMRASLVETQRLINFRMGAFDQLEAMGFGASNDGSGGSAKEIIYGLDGKPVK